jgi:hypothetical protein
MPVLGLFVGVVSHPQTSFVLNQGPEGLAALLSETLDRNGCVTKYVVNVDNAFDKSGIKPGRSVYTNGIAEEVRLETVWNRFLGVNAGLPGLFKHFARWLRVQSFRWREPNISEIRRLINIELSHTQLMKQGLESGAEWVLILEDDASAENIDDLATGLDALMRSDQSTLFINLSNSFSIAELGISHLLTLSTALAWAGTTPRAIMQSNKPATNTVCAVLYRRDFLEHLVTELDSMPIEPVVPIDWRLNQALMNMWQKGLVGPGDCCFIDPAPIVQLSMHQ